MYHHPHVLSDMCGSARRTLEQMAGQINASNRFPTRGKTDLVNQDKKLDKETNQNVSLPSSLEH